MEDELYNQGREADQAFEKKEEDIAPWDEETPKPAFKDSNDLFMEEQERQRKIAEKEAELSPAELDPRMK